MVFKYRNNLLTAQHFEIRGMELSLHCASLSGPLSLSLTHTLVNILEYNRVTVGAQEKPQFLCLLLVNQYWADQIKRDCVNSRVFLPVVQHTSLPWWTHNPAALRLYVCLCKCVCMWMCVCLIQRAHLAAATSGAQHRCFLQGTFQYKNKEIHTSYRQDSRY